MEIYSLRLIYIILFKNVLYDNLSYKKINRKDERVEIDERD